MDEERVRKELTSICKLMYDRGLTFSSGGNVSARLDDEHILIIPSGKNKGLLLPEDMVKVHMDGSVIGQGKPSIELGIHLALYSKRKDLGAVLHCHPPYCTALAIKGERLRSFLTPEGAILLGEVPMSKYQTPGTDRLVEELSSHHLSNAILMERHGAITTGKDLMEAFNRMEEMEFHARLQHILGDKGREFDTVEIKKIRGM